MMNLIQENMDLIIAGIVVVVTFILGKLSKKSKYINNNLIIFQDIIIGGVSTIAYTLITKDFSVAITVASSIAASLHDAINSGTKLIKEKTKEVK